MALPTQARIVIVGGGIVGQMRPNRNMTRMSRYGIGLYAKLEAETGLATGWKQCGSVNFAATERRLGSGGHHCRGAPPLPGVP
ncbi:MAG: hypothetical protein IPG91_16545 [Ideonella sp.]|nr:hypothetical protein [Ideonella sp.]